jgi:two-component system cell cycle sensor histidine kinase/response regulator CckA
MAVSASFPLSLSLSSSLSPSGADTGTEMRLLFQNAPVGIAQCDCRGNILAMNPALTSMLAGQPQAVQNLRFRDLIPVEGCDSGEGIFRQLMSGERASFQIERFIQSSGAPLWLRWTAWGVCGGAHHSDGVLLLAEDITESRKQEQRAAQAERLQALGRMAGSIAHDFNNLLTGILLYCDLMLDCLRPECLTAEHLLDGGLRASERLRKYAKEIRSASIQATGVVQQLLTLTRPRNQNPHPLSLNTIAEGMRDLLLRLMGENIELCFRLDPGLGMVNMDSAQAHQVLLNLVLNARDAMPGGGRIQLETGNCRLQIFREVSAPGDPGVGPLAAIPCVLFVVSDNGAGMEEETRQRVFQSYFTTKEEGRGSGIGLATVHEIVAGGGGLIQVDSAPGRGTRVTVLLPSAGAAAIDAEPRQGSPQAAA